MSSSYKYRKTIKLDWLSDIPTEWEEVRLGSLFNERKSKVSDTEYPALSVTKKGIVPQLENAAKSNDGDNRKLVLKGDFVINSRSDRKGSSGLSLYDGSVSLINIVLKPIEVVPQYSEYLLKSYVFKEEYYRYGRGIVEDLWTTRYSEMKNMMLPKPSKEEQTKIAAFLDYKLAKIDRFIRKKKRLIKLLNEQKAAIITNAVTKGLDPNAKMKTSGIKWLGDIPEHWEEWKLNRIATKITQGPNPNYNLGTPSSSFKVLKTKDVYDHIIHYKQAHDISEETFTSELNAVLIEGDILITIVGHGSIGKVNIFHEQEKARYIFSRAIGLLRLKPEFQSMLGFIKAFFHSKAGKIIFDLGTDGSTGQEIVKTSFVKKIKIPLPPSSEQTSIVEFVNLESEKISKAITTIEKEIALTQEYKTALIADAVTGKIDVRDYEIPELVIDEKTEELVDEIDLMEGEVALENEEIEE